MNNKYMLGSILCILLMLVSTQTFLIDFATSNDPPIHEGTAYVGNLWMSELNVSSTLEEIDFIGVGHANATDDYVTWESGEGEIVANWTVDIETESHPDYCVIFSLMAYNIDDNNSEMDNDYSVVNYDENTKYNDDGQLRLSIQFDQDFLENNTEATLVCYLNAAVKINNTEEAKNFTIWAQDRCVVGVVFDSEISEEPYSRFTKEANSEFPNIWSWLPGWNESNRFDDEEDMLESQTFFSITGNEQSEEGDWLLGDLTVEIEQGRYHTVYERNNPVEYHIQFDPSGYQEITPFITIDYEYISGYPISINRFYLYKKGVIDPLFFTSNKDEYFMGKTNGKLQTVLKVYDDDANAYSPTNQISVKGYVWSMCTSGIHPYRLSGTIIIDSGTGSVPSTSPVIGYYWINSCSYYNTTYNLIVDSATNFGITTVDCDISNVLLDNEQHVYTYAADVGNTQIQLSC